MNDSVIHEIRLDAQRNDENFQIHTEAAVVISESDAAALHIDDGLPQRHAALLARLDEALKNIVKSHKTEEIHAADKKRDESYRALVAYVKAMCLYDDLAVRVAAERIMIVLETYGNVVNKSYEEETSAIYNLVQELMSAKYAADVAAINATRWVNRLGADNNAVSTHISERDNENVAKSHINVRAARKAVDDVYRSIVLRVNSHARVDATPAIKTFVAKMNLIVKRFNTLMKQHRGHHGHHGHGKDGAGAPEGGA